MTHHNVYQKLGYRISEEVQLLAEKKWIIDALAKIKNQRNSLQVVHIIYTFQIVVSSIIICSILCSFFGNHLPRNYVVTIV